MKSRETAMDCPGTAGAYRQALEELPVSLRECFPLLRGDQRQEVETLVASYYLINQQKSLRKEARRKGEAHRR